jgi:hypothetical protein
MLVLIHHEQHHIEYLFVGQDLLRFQLVLPSVQPLKKQLKINTLLRFQTSVSNRFGSVSKKREHNPISDLYEPKLAVYDDTRIIEKYHHTLATNRPDIDLKYQKSNKNLFEIIYLGIKSTPCCIKAANAKNSVFNIENLFDNCDVASSSILHSYGEKRETRKSITLTPIYANVTHIHISLDNGVINENTP